MYVYAYVLLISGCSSPRKDTGLPKRQPPTPRRAAPTGRGQLTFFALFPFYYSRVIELCPTNRRQDKQFNRACRVDSLIGLCFFREGLMVARIWSFYHRKCIIQPSKGQNLGETSLISNIFSYYKPYLKLLKWL